MTLRYDSASGQWIDSDAEEKVTETERGGTASQQAEGGEAAQAAASEMQPQKPVYSPIPEEPEKKEKNRKPLFIGIGIAAVICMVIGVAAAIGLFGNPSKKILTALQNTFKDETNTAKFLQQLQELTRDEYTISVKGSMDEASVSLQYCNDRKEPQIRGSYEDYWTEKVEFLASITENKVKAQIPYLGDYVFTYDYQGEKTGYLFKDATQEEIEILDLACEYLYEINNQKSFDDEILKIFLEEYNSWKFQKVEAKAFRINGERIQCEGYKTIVSSERLIAILGEIEDLYVENELDYWNQLPDYIDNPFEELYTSLEDVLDLEITVYLADDQVACILMETEDEQMKISFKGNKNGAQDIEVEVDNYSILEIVHETVKTEEKTTVSFYGAKALVFTYDAESGSFDFSLEYDYSMASLSGTLEINEEEMKMSVDSLSFIYESIDDLECEMVVKKGADIEEIVGEEFELSTATEDEIYDMFDRIYSNLLGEDFGPGFYDDDYDDYDMTPQEIYEEYFYDMTPEEFLELFPEYSMDDITGEANL